MKESAQEVGWVDVRDSHARYLREMNCQVVHASLHGREGWAKHYGLRDGERKVGHAGVLVGGPWAGTRTVFEFFVEREWRTRAMALFEALRVASEATHARAQTNDVLLATLVHGFTQAVTCEKILFQDAVTTSIAAPHTVFRLARPEDAARVFAHAHEPVGDYVLECDGEIAATGGVMYHYNPPYGDVYMEVAPNFRRRGLGAYLVQELKRVCREAGKVPCARCDPGNVASRRTCSRAGFEAVGAIVSGPLAAVP